MPSGASKLGGRRAYSGNQFSITWAWGLSSVYIVRAVAAFPLYMPSEIVRKVYAMLIVLENGVPIRELELLAVVAGSQGHIIRGNLIHRFAWANRKKFRLVCGARTQNETFNSPSQPT